MDATTSLFGLQPAALAAGVAAAISIWSFTRFVSTTRLEVEHKRRMRLVTSQREKLRDANTVGDGGRARTQASDQRLERALSRLKLEHALEDSALKARLARAGLRTRGDRMRFVLMQVLLPFVFGALFVVGYHVVMKPEDASLTMNAAVFLAGCGFGYLYPGLRIDGLAAQRKKKIRATYPDALDLLTICVEAGMSIEAAMNKVSSELGSYAVEMVEELRILTSELAYLGDRRMAFENFVQRVDLPSVRTLVSALIQAERYGTPIGQALRVLAAESRFDRMARAEEKAASLPAKLTVPMMVFFVPVLFIVIIGPAILQMMDQFAKN